MAYKYKIDIRLIEYYSDEHEFTSKEPLTPVELAEIAEDAIYEGSPNLDICETHIDTVEVTKLPD